MRQAILVAIWFVISAVVYLLWKHADFGSRMPPELSSDIPFVDGIVISGRRTLFEDGRGYVIDIQTDLTYGGVLQYYGAQIGGGAINKAPGMGAQFSVAEFRLGSKRIYLEIHAQEEITRVTTAVHLGSWW